MAGLSFLPSFLAGSHGIRAGLARLVGGRPESGRVRKVLLFCGVCSVHFMFLIPYEAETVCVSAATRGMEGKLFRFYVEESSLWNFPGPGQDWCGQWENPPENCPERFFKVHGL
jgi:hypothetical protein